MKELQIRRINALLEIEWSRPCNNASDAHFKASRITDLQKQKEKLCEK